MSIYTRREKPPEVDSTIIVGIGHRQNTGKDTFARFVTAELRDRTTGIAIESRSFASKLKDTTYSLYQWTGIKPPQYYKDFPEHKKDMIPALGITMRQLWIDMGQHMRKYDENVWVNATLRNNLPHILFIRDLRFPNEANQIRELGGVLVKMIRPGEPEIDDEADKGLKHWTDWDEQYSCVNLSGIKDAATSFADKLLYKLATRRRVT